MTKVYSYLMVLFLFSNSFGQQSEISATPQRPSFSTSTSTTSLGCLEVESGVTFDDVSTVMPVAIKLGASRRFEVFAGLTPIVESGQNFEDITLGGRWRFAERTNQLSCAVQASATTFRSNFAEEMNYSFLFIMSHAPARVGIDFNAGLNLLDAGDEQVFGILTLSKTLSSNLSGYGEIFTQHCFDFNEQVVVGSVGGSYSISPRFVLDAALNINIVNAVADLQFLIGATTTLARLW